MGLALCHGIPRDLFLLIALLFFVVAFILEAIVIGRHSSKTSAGYFTRKDDGGGGVDSDERVGFIGGHPATYVTAAGGDGYTKTCNPSAAMLRYHCARFAEAFHLLNGLVLASFISCVLFVFAALFLVVRVSRTTSGILFNMHLLAALPTGLQCAVIAIFFVRVVPNARHDFLTALYPGDDGARLAFHRRYASNLMIAATVLVCVGYVMIAVKYFVAVSTRRRLKRERIKQRDIDAMMKMHLVNDDWERQKQILRSHAKSVHVEMEIRKEDRDRMEGESDGNVVDNTYRHGHRPSRTHSQVAVDAASSSARGGRQRKDGDGAVVDDQPTSAEEEEAAAAGGNPHDGASPMLYSLAEQSNHRQPTHTSEGHEPVDDYTHMA